MSQMTTPNDHDTNMFENSRGIDIMTEPTHVILTVPSLHHYNTLVLEPTN